MVRRYIDAVRELDFKKYNSREDLFAKLFALLHNVGYDEDYPEPVSAKDLVRKVLLELEE